MNLWVLREGRPEIVLATPFQETNARLSPDGRWLTFSSDRSGTVDIYVRPYPGPGPEATVSTQGGSEPVWAPDGSELFYMRGRSLMAVTVDVTNGFHADAPRVLFEYPGIVGLPVTNYDAAPDGEHFVLVRPRSEARAGGGQRLILVENFLEELKRLGPN
jgi:Tol biopolymer transport system component